MFGGPGSEIEIARNNNSHPAYNHCPTRAHRYPHPPSPVLPLLSASLCTLSPCCSLCSVAATDAAPPIPPAAAAAARYVVLVDCRLVSSFLSSARRCKDSQVRCSVQGHLTAHQRRDSEQGEGVVSVRYHSGRRRRCAVVGRSHSTTTTTTIATTTSSQQQRSARTWTG